ncbi:hypothetical protein P0Y31_09590 [Knoellia sp. 3-2P3]|uniref:hypothetical protein n=1 Tax=unclassified Knoellia TaxID=2618719 RepID=UPI0023D9C077|nr:hypothetical protein [Knoellia sp. 3-2P3]MDF2092596.1 hypothetical protein [Knoellia sp. 3-2P3]
MSTLRALPYRTADDALQVSLRTEDTSIVERSDESLDLYTEFSGTARFTLEAKIDEAGLLPTIPEGTEAADELQFVVVTRSVSSRTRSVLLTAPAQSVTTTLSMDSSAYRGKVELSALIVRAAESVGQATAGLAHRAGAVVAEASLATLWFDEPPVESGNAIDIQWVDFREQDRLPDDHLFAVRMEEAPAIFLNTAIPHAHSVLTSRGTHGAKARIRDAVFAQIVHQVWSGILAHCFLEAAAVIADDPEERLAGLADWERQVLTDWALYFHPGEQSTTTATRRLMEQITENDGLLALERMTDVIQARIDALKPFNGLVKDAHLFGLGNTE